MALLVLIVLALAALLILAAAKKKSDAGPSGAIGFPYQAAGPLFSPAERSFLGVLDSAVGHGFRVFGKVRVADVAALRPGLDNAARQGALNRISAKHFDFVVCRTGDLAVVAAVELNDKSHASLRAQARDDLLVNVCRVINLPLIVVAAKSSYMIPELQAQFLAAIAP